VNGEKLMSPVSPSSLASLIVFLIVGYATVFHLDLKISDDPYINIVTQAFIVSMGMSFHITEILTDTDSRIITTLNNLPNESYWVQYIIRIINNILILALWSALEYKFIFFGIIVILTHIFYFIWDMSTDACSEIIKMDYRNLWLSIFFLAAVLIMNKLPQIQESGIKITPGLINFILGILVSAHFLQFLNLIRSNKETLFTFIKRI
jgi:hypothetical protein